MKEQAQTAGISFRFQHKTHLFCLCCATAVHLFRCTKPCENAAMTLFFAAASENTPMREDTLTPGTARRGAFVALVWAFFVSLGSVSLCRVEAQRGANLRKLQIGRKYVSHKRGPRKGEWPLWGKEKHGNRWSFSLAENGALFTSLRRGKHRTRLVAGRRKIGQMPEPTLQLRRKL